MIKVCHIVDTLQIGGLEKTIIDIVSNLKSYEHQIWCLKEKGALAGEVEGRGIKVKEFGFRGGVRLSSLSVLVKELKGEKIKIVHCHGHYPSIWGRLAAIFAGVPVRIEHCQSLYYRLLLKEKIKLRSLSLFTTKIIAVSEAVRKSLIESVGIRPDKIVVIYNSAPAFPAADPHRREEARRALGIGQGYFVIGNIGRVEEMKGHRFLIDAVAKLKAEGQKCACVIAGAGSETEAVRALIKSLGLETSVFLLGVRRDIADILAAMDVFVQPSTIREGLPLALAEAASAGLPLVATGVGGNPEIVADGVNGYIVEPKDAGAIAGAIRRLMADPAKRSAMGEASKNIWQDKFSTEIMVRKVREVYDSYCA